MLHGLNEITGGFGPGTWFAYASMGILALMVPFAMWAIEGIERAPIQTSKPAPPAPKLRPRASERGRSSEEPAPKRAPGGRPNLTVVTAAIAAMLSNANFNPRDPAAFERAALIAQENPGLTQEALAEQSGVKRQTLGRWMDAVPEAFKQAA